MKSTILATKEVEAMNPGTAVSEAHGLSVEKVGTLDLWGINIEDMVS